MPDLASEKPNILPESPGGEVRQVTGAGSAAPGTMRRGRPPARRYGQWLREQRLMRCWSGGEMARRLHEAAASAGYKLPDNRCLLVMIYRWEDDRSGISARYRTLYCRALGIPFSEFGKPVPQPPAPAAPLLSDVLTDVAQMLAQAAVKLLGALEACEMTPGTVAESARSISALADRVLSARRASPPGDSADLIRHLTMEAQA